MLYLASLTRACSSVGQSVRLIHEMSMVRVHPGPLRFVYTEQCERAQCKNLCFMPNFHIKRTTIKDIIKFRKLPPKERITILSAKKKEAEVELKELYRNFRGVKHENSVSEIRYTQIKVLEGYIATLQEEIVVLSKK